MKFKLDFNIDESEVKFDHSDEIILIGSCFSTEIANKLILNGFNVEVNPFGTLFHPSAILNVLKSSVSNDSNVFIKQSDDVFHSWDSAGGVYGMSEVELRERVKDIRKNLKKSIESAKVLIITFGTAWGYQHNQLKCIVGNCHKENQNQFTKVLSTVSELENDWVLLFNEMKSLNPELNVIFTVSPVRHKKDGLIENNRSKARLIELVHRIVDKTTATYFPSYEILIDELRDYRFYSEDLVHPSQAAVDYVWSQFENSFCSHETKMLSQEVQRIKRSESHKTLYPNSKADKFMKEMVSKKKEQILLKYPFLNI